jgi:uncharacterized membrane protein
MSQIVVSGDMTHSFGGEPFWACRVIRLDNGYQINGRQINGYQLPTSRAAAAHK